MRTKVEHKDLNQTLMTSVCRYYGAAPLLSIELEQCILKQESYVWIPVTLSVIVSFNFKK